MTDDVRELVDGTPGSEHTYIRNLCCSLRVGGTSQCTPANLKRLMQAHPAFSCKNINVFLIKSSNTTRDEGPLSSTSIDKESPFNCNIQRVAGVGDFMIIYG
jgi:hypothetical protein